MMLDSGPAMETSAETLSNYRQNQTVGLHLRYAECYTNL